MGGCLSTNIESQNKERQLVASETDLKQAHENYKITPSIKCECNCKCKQKRKISYASSYPRNEYTLTGVRTSTHHGFPVG